MRRCSLTQPRGSAREEEVLHLTGRALVAQQGSMAGRDGQLERLVKGRGSVAPGRRDPGNYHPARHIIEPERFRIGRARGTGEGDPSPRARFLSDRLSPLPAGPVTMDARAAPQGLVT
jgi:hypothetical protein